MYYIHTRIHVQLPFIKLCEIQVDMTNKCKSRCSSKAHLADPSGGQLLPVMPRLCLEDPSAAVGQVQKT